MYRPLAAAAAKLLSALTARGGVSAEIALLDGSAATLALQLLQQALQWPPSTAGREASLYIAQSLASLANSGGIQHSTSSYLACSGSFQGAGEFCTSTMPYPGMCRDSHRPRFTAAWLSQQLQQQQQAALYHKACSDPCHQSQLYRMACAWVRSRHVQSVAQSRA